MGNIRNFFAVFVTGCTLISGCSSGGIASTARSGTSDASASAQSASATTASTTSPARGGQASAQAAPATITLAFAGDVHFERQVAALLKDSSRVWRNRLPELRDADFSLVNLETAITTRGRAERKPYTFRAPPKALEVLKWAGIDAVSMANNHAADFGAAGVQDTLKAKASNVMPIVGFGADDAQAYTPLEVDVKGVKVAVLAASQVAEETARNWAAGPNKPGIAVALDRTRLRAAVQAAAAKYDLVVVQLHWGTEGTTCPNGNQVDTVKDLRAVGADVIVGTHAHRPLGSGWSGRAFVGYGTGNFVWYNTSANSRPSGVLTLTVDAKAAKARGQATGSARQTARSLVTSYTWSPKYISGKGVPQNPTAGVRKGLDSRNRAAISCSKLAQKP